MPRVDALRLAAALALSVALPPVLAASIDADRVCALAAAETRAWRPRFDPVPLAASATRERPLPLLRDLMLAPESAPCRVARLAQVAAAASGSPTAAMRWLSELAGVSADEAPQPDRAGAIDPLAAALDALRGVAAVKGHTWTPALPSEVQLPEPLRREVALLLAAIAGAHHQLLDATKRLPAQLDGATLRAQALHGAAAPAPEHDILRLLSLLDRRRLAQGMVELVAAVERFARFAASAGRLPAVSWRTDTPLGAVIVDTSGSDDEYTVAAPLLLVDTGGNDRYRFAAAPPARHVAVLFDHGGDDTYVALADGADPSAATVGYTVLWDSGGNDRHDGSHLAQAAAVLGAALLVDEGGDDRFVAQGHAQGYGLGGLALLLAIAGNDRYEAVTHAQGSAGPLAAAALVDAGGDDAYALLAEPLLRPSPQAAALNTSMGQGAGRGWRPTAQRPGAAGGVGALIDLAGNDRYRAQVFAQGAGFYEGLGILVDGGGSDSFDAAWYAMGAAAHAAASVFLELGGDDRYHASRSTSLGAAHDGSLAAFVDTDGDDDYALGDLGLGASHEGGVALFVDGGGANRYWVEAAPCRAFGWAGNGAAGAARADALARFADRGCGAASKDCARSCDRR